MWASKTNYAQLYSKQYFGKQGQATSFDKDKLPDGVVNLCRKNALTTVVDIGAGSGYLGAELSSRGLGVISCDIEPCRDEICPYKLSEFSAEQNRNIKKRLQHPESANYLVTCFDVLEHIDKEDVSAALENLHSLVGEWLLVSVSTRPSSQGNSYHSTVLPLATWIELFAVYGFELTDRNALPGCKSVITNSKGAPGRELVDYWADSDIFSDIANGEPNYLLLRSTRRTTELAEQRVGTILDLHYLKEKRTNASQSRYAGVIGLNIQHFQDFLNMRPILDVLNPKKTIVLLRDQAPSLAADERDIIIGFFRRSATKVIEYRQVADLDFSQLPVSVLISASESTVALNHVLSLELVEYAKLNSIPTVLLQHGIWIETFGITSIPFSSQYVVSWGREHEQFFLRLRERDRQGSTQEFRPLGSPKYFDTRCCTNRSVVKYRLGVNVEKFKKVVLVGTNLHWTEHALGRAELASGLSKLIDDNPDVYFIIKCHPSERASQYRKLKRRNCMVIDDIIMTCIDLSIGRLLQSIDLVISSLSTLLLDAAIAGVRCIQYETSNRLSYQYCESVGLDHLSGALKDESFSSVTLPEFIEYYADNPGDNFYLEFFSLLEKVTASSFNYDNDAVYMVSKAAESVWIRYVELDRKFSSLHQEAKRGGSALKPVLPEDFDPARYLDLHPDVKKAGMDPARHYLDHGFYENRAYK